MAVKKAQSKSASKRTSKKKVAQPEFAILKGTKKPLKTTQKRQFSKLQKEVDSILGAQTLFIGALLGAAVIGALLCVLVGSAIML